MTHKEANFAGCPSCGALFHLDHLEWVKEKDAALSSLRAEVAELQSKLGRAAEALCTEDCSVEYIDGPDTDPTSIPWSDEYGVGVFRIFYPGIGSHEIDGFPATADSEDLIYLPAPDAPLHEHLAFIGRIAEAVEIREFAIESPTYRNGDTEFRVTFWLEISACPGDASDLSWAALLAATEAGRRR